MKVPWRLFTPVLEHNEARTVPEESHQLHQKLKSEKASALTLSPVFRQFWVTFKERKLRKLPNRKTIAVFATVWCIMLGDSQQLSSRSARTRSWQRSVERLFGYLSRRWSQLPKVRPIGQVLREVIRIFLSQEECLDLHFMAASNLSGLPKG